jgi:hypothetical protein
MRFDIGACFWLGNAKNDLEHLHFVISRPTKDGRILVVNISNYYKETRAGHLQDTSCILKPGDHVCIKKESIVKYSEAFPTTVHELERQLELGLARDAERASITLIRKIQQGAKVSTFIRGKCKPFFQLFE